MFSRLSKTKKIITVSTWGFALICLSIVFLIDSGFIQASHQTALAIMFIGLLPALTFTFSLFGKRKVKRKAFTKITKDRVLKRQSYRCNVCGINAEHWDFDHIGSRGDNSVKNCQALCLNCHREKTLREARQRKK